MTLEEYKRLIRDKLAEHLSRVHPADSDQATALETVRIDLAKAQTLMDLLLVISKAYVDPSLYLRHVMEPFFELSKEEVNPTPGLTLTKGKRWQFTRSGG